MVTQVRAIDLFYQMKGELKKGLKKTVKPKLDSVRELKRLGERIKQLRISKGYTSYEYFAYEHNISRAQFGRYEKGQDLRLSSLIKVINAFDLTLLEFFSEGFD